MGELLAIAGASFVGSLGIGAFKKHKTALPNGIIPYSNPTITGGGTALLTGDLGATAAAMAGSLAATGVHQAWKRIRRRLR